MQTPTGDGQGLLPARSRGPIPGRYRAAAVSIRSVEDFLRQIEQAVLPPGAYYLAPAGALMMPDMCAALEAADGETNAARNRAWFDTNVAAQLYGNVTGDDCYRFRCALLHQGSTQNPQGQYARVLFLEPAFAL